MRSSQHARTACFVVGTFNDRSCATAGKLNKQVSKLILKSLDTVYLFVSLRILLLPKLKQYVPL